MKEVPFEDRNDREEKRENPWYIQAFTTDERTTAQDFVVYTTGAIIAGLLISLAALIIVGITFLCSLLF